MDNSLLINLNPINFSNIINDNINKIDDFDRLLIENKDNIKILKIKKCDYISFTFILKLLKYSIKYDNKDIINFFNNELNIMNICSYIQKNRININILLEKENDKIDKYDNNFLIIDKFFDSKSIIDKIKDINDIYYLIEFCSSFTYDKLNKYSKINDNLNTKINSIINTIERNFIFMLNNKIIKLNPSFQFEDKISYLVKIMKFYYANNIKFYQYRIIRKAYVKKGKVYLYYFNKANEYVEKEVTDEEYSQSNAIIKIENISDKILYIHPKDKYEFIYSSNLNELNDRYKYFPKINHINDSHNYYDEIDKFTYFSSKNIKFERIPENDNEKTFDFIRFHIGVLNYNKENVEFAKKNKNEIIKRAFKFISENKEFKSYGVPINFIKLSSMKYTRSLDCLFEFKEE